MTTNMNGMRLDEGYTLGDWGRGMWVVTGRRLGKRVGMKP